MTTFTEDGFREVQISLPNETIERAASKWKSFIPAISNYPDTYAGKGIVICAGGVKYLTCSWVLISMLRYQGCQLPIEIWYKGNEILQEVANELAKLGVECKNIHDYVKEARSYAIKPLSILHSQFKEVLFLDADNVTVTDPTYLFDDKHYKKFGTLFWPDYWKTSPQNPIWDLLEVSYQESKEQESGEILINKSMCWRELTFCTYLNAHPEIYYQLLHGDKDTFRFAWLALKSEYYMIETATASCGYIGKENLFNGLTMVQHDPSGHILFLHRNLLKWDITLNTEVFWDVIKRFKQDAGVQKYHFKHGEKSHLALDISGDTEYIDFKIEFPTLEKKCLSFLEKLRRSGFYSRYVLFDYIKMNRLLNR